MKEKSLLVKRRTFLKTGIVVTGVLLTGVVLDRKYKPRSKNIARELISYLESHHLANTIGASLIASSPALQQLSLDPLIDIVLADANVSRGSFSLFKPSQLARFQHQVRLDFTNENIVLVNGWFLSVTEAHLCAVLHRYLNPLS